jgi:hypothetical protein
MEPTVRERQRRRAAKLLIYVKSRLEMHVDPWLKAAARDIYGGGGEHAMRELCEIMTDLPASERDRLLNRPDDLMCLRLRKWWDEHKIQDALRKKKVSRK